MSQSQTSHHSDKSIDQLFAELIGEPKPTAPAEQDSQPCE